MADFFGFERSKREKEEISKLRRLQIRQYEQALEKATQIASPELLETFFQQFPQAPRFVKEPEITRPLVDPEDPIGPRFRTNLPPLTGEQRNPWEGPTGGPVPLQRTEKDVLTALDARAGIEPILKTRIESTKEIAGIEGMDAFLEEYARDNPKSNIGQNLEAFKGLDPESKQKIVDRLGQIATPIPGVPGATIQGYNLAKVQHEARKTGTPFKSFEQYQLDLKAAGKTTVDVRVGTEATKATQSKLEIQIIEGTNTIGRLDRMMEQFEPEFLRYGGRALAAGIKLTDKAGLLGKVEDTAEFLFGSKGTQAIADSKAFTQRFNKFVTDVKVAMFLWRKFITGVAGGEKEMAKIEDVVANINDAPLTFPSKVQELKALAEATIKWARELYAAGILKPGQSKPERDEILKEFPIESYMEIVPDQPIAPERTKRRSTIGLE